MMWKPLFFTVVNVIPVSCRILQANIYTKNKGVKRLSTLPLIITSEELDHWLQRSEEGEVLFFKHSTACPISAAAFDELQSFLQTEQKKRVDVAMVHVIENRDISNRITEHYNIKHESPQVLLIQKGKVLWHTSHWDITQDTLYQAVHNTL